MKNKGSYFKSMVFELIFSVISLVMIIFVIFFRIYKEELGYTYITYSMILYAILVIISLIANNIINRKSQKKDAEERRAQMLSLMNIVNAFVVVWSEDKAFVQINEKLENYIASEKDGLTNRELVDRIFPQSFMTQTKADMMLSDTKELPLKINDNIKYIAWTSSILSVNYESGHEVRLIISIGFDVTENKSIRQQMHITNNRLAASERLYSLAMGLSEIGIILNEHCSDSFYISRELQNMLGLRDEGIRIDEFIKLIHRDDCMLFETYLKAARTNSIETLHTNNMDMRIMSADGEYHWYSFRYKNIQEGKFGMPIIGGAIIDIAREKEKDMLIERMAYVDEVTGIYNRNKLMINGQEMYECCKILELSYWVIVFDVDRFHIINDACGYDSGNQILKDFADILYKYKRKMGFAARVGGDNFVLIVQDYGDSNIPKMIIKGIQNDFSNIGNKYTYKQTLTCSAGYCKMPDDGENFVTVFERAEFALSTGEKKTSVIKYDSTVHDRIIKGTALEKSLADAIEAGELRLYYQPKISLSTRKIMGVEALIRWIKPNGEVIEPDKFVPIAENSHLITRIGEYVMDEACRQNKKWQDMGLPKIVMSINLTSEDFYQKNIKNYIQDILDKTGLEPEWLEIELTESLAMKDIDFAAQQMQELRDMGLKLAMDDFGTGYSSLSYIQKMPISLLKLDMSFIMLLEEDLVAQEIVSAVIKIAKSKKIETIAEGTETEGQVKILEKFGCDYAQGFLFGKPVCADELTEYLKNSMNK